MKGNKIKNFSDLISYNRLFIVYSFLCLSIGLSLRIITVGGMFKILPLITDLLFIILFGSFGYLFKEKNRFIYYTVLLFFFALLSAGNTLYYQFYQSFISVNLISTASMIGKVNDSLFAKIHLIQFIYLIFPIMFIILRKKLLNNNVSSEVVDALRD